MGKIVTIGSGSMEALETLAIDKEIIALSGKESPRALFIPTASSDSVERWEIFNRVYGERLGCKTNVLYLLNRNPSQNELQDKILSSDLIYVGGGNSLKMMRRWRRLGVDRILETAYDRGVVLSGLSAGCICWYKYGHSNSMEFYHPEQWDYIRVKSLGLIDATVCPSYNGGPEDKRRDTDFQQMMKKPPEVGIAIDSHCALEYVDGEYRVITSQEGAKAHKLYKRRGELVIERIEQKKGFTPITELLPNV